MAIHAPRSTAPRTRFGMPNQTIKAARPDTSVCFIHGSVESRLSGSIGAGGSSYGPRGFRPIGITSAGRSRLERSTPHFDARSIGVATDRSGLLRESRADRSGELDFIGAYEQRRSERGWRQPDDLAALASLYELDAEPSPEDSAILQSLMNAGHADRVEFMG